MVERGSDGKGPDPAIFKLKAATMCGDPKMLADAMKIYTGAKNVNIRNCALEGSELFGSTKRKLNLPPYVDCDSHQPDKVNYSIHRPNTRATRQLTEESLNSTMRCVAHITSVLEIDCLASNCNIAKLPPNSTKRSWALQAITGTMCNAKVETGKHGTPAPTYKGLRKEFRSPNNVEYEFWFCHNDIKRCVSGSNKKYVLDWPIVPNTWPVKICTNLSREEVLALEDVGFQPQQREVLPLVIGFQQSQLSPSLACIFVCQQTRTPTLHSSLGSQCVVIQRHRWRITKINGRSPNSWKVTMWLGSLSFHIWALE